MIRVSATFECMLSDKSWQAVVDSLTVSSAPRGESPFPLTSRSDATLDAVKSYILSNNLIQGDPLPTEAQLCKELGVSRTSIREALRKLEALDIVTRQQGKGTFVGGMSLKPMVESLILRSALTEGNVHTALHEVVFLRQSLDLGVADTLVEAIRGKKNDELHGLVEVMEAKAKKGETFLDEDIDFHETLLSALEVPLVGQLTRSLWLVHMATVPKLNTVSAEGLIQTAKAHADMITAAEQGDSAAYQKAVIAHYAPLLNRFA